jgi:hypothetical protein
LFRGRIRRIVRQQVGIFDLALRNAVRPQPRLKAPVSVS